MCEYETPIQTGSGCWTQWVKILIDFKTLSLASYFIYYYPISVHMKVKTGYN